MNGSDSQLVRGTLSGHNSAFDGLVERYRSRVFRFALGRLRSADDAFDTAQEAFVRAYMSLSSLENPDRFAFWLMAIADNLCKMRLRQRRESAVPMEVIDNIESPPEAAPPISRDSLESLPERTRVAASMFFVDGMKQSEIAERLGISLAAVKARVREARTRLQKEMIHMAPVSKTKDDPGEEFTASLKHKLELAGWYRRLAEELESGGNVMTGLDALYRGDYSQSLKDATKKMVEAIEGGSTITDALAEAPVLASPEISAMIRAGEMVGSLHIAARCLADWMEVQDAQRSIEVIFWCRSFGYLLTAGVPIVETLRYGLGIARSKALQQATREMVSALQRTRMQQPTESPLRPVLDRYVDIFPPVMRLAALAGEWSGCLDKTLFWAADEMADDLARAIARPLVPSQRDLAPRRFGVTGLEEVLPEQCIRFLDDHAPDMRAAAIDVLGRLNQRDAAAQIVPRLDDDSAEVRRTALRVLAVLGHGAAEEAIVQRLRDADPTVRRTAVEAIAQIGLHSAAGPLAEAMRDTDHRVMITAIESLQAMGEMEVIRQKTVELLGSESGEDQRLAAYLLRNFVPDSDPTLGQGK